MSSLISNGIVSDIAISLIKSWQNGSRGFRVFLTSGFILGGIGGIILVLGDAGIIPRDLSRALGSIGLVYLAIIVVTTAARQEIKDQVESERKIEEVEERVRENPKETQAAWELARVKLESYLNRNINQVRSIFWLTLFVMAVGFSLIIYGVVILYKDPTLLHPSIIAACSGVLVNFIGATFLIIYKATMNQAKDYVTVLERINAVGMAVQILDTIEDKDGDIKPQATADLAKQLLQLYTANVKKK